MRIYLRCASRIERLLSFHKMKPPAILLATFGFRIMPLMGEWQAAGRLNGPAHALMNRTGPCVELYDTVEDPQEIQDLSASKLHEYQAALTRVSATLDAWMTETGDRGAIPEAPEVVAPFEKEMHDWFGTPAWAR